MCEGLTSIFGLNLLEVGSGDPGTCKGTAGPIAWVQRLGMGLHECSKGPPGPAQRLYKAGTRPCGVQACKEHAPELGEVSMHGRRPANLGHLPLGAVGLRDLEVDALDAARGTHDLDAAQVGPEVLEDTLRQLEEVAQARVVGHVLRQVGKQHCHVEADVAGWLLEAVGELLTVDHLVLICFGAGKQELDFWACELLLAVHSLRSGRGGRERSEGRPGSLSALLKNSYGLFIKAENSRIITITQG